MKKLLSLLMVVCMMLSLSACRNTESSNDESSNDLKGNHINDAQKVEEAERNEQSKIEKNDNDVIFPKMDHANDLLGRDIVELQNYMRVGNFQGTNSSYRSMASDIFYLKGTDSIDFYMETDYPHFMGTKDGKLVLEGWRYDLQFSVRTLVGENATSPAIYTVDAPPGDSSEYQAYVWEIDDGYMALIVPHTSQNWYDNLVYSRVEIPDINYLEYVDKNDAVAEDEPNQSGGKNNGEKQNIINAFCSDIEGIWVDLDTAPDRTLDGMTYYSYMEIKDDKIRFGDYCGYTDRYGTITDVIALSNNSYKITIYYPEEEWFGTMEPEIEETYTVTIQSNTFQIGEDGTIWTYMGSDSFDETMIAVQQELDSSQGNGYSENNFPSIPISSLVLDTEYTILSTKHNLLGPEWKYYFNDDVEFWFALNDTSGISFYKDYDSDTYYGIENGKVVFGGQYGLFDCKASELLPNEALTTEATIYNKVGPRDNDAYVWKMENGYLVMCLEPLNSLPYYQRPVFCLFHISDINYLSYIK